jgi:type IV pilus assembly protein PilA
MKKQGFTLMELLIVIAIIAILATVLIPSLLNVRKAANTAAAVAYVRNTVISVETVKSSNNWALPNTITTGTTCASIPNNRALPITITSCSLSVPSTSTPGDPNSYNISATTINGVSVVFDGNGVSAH